jgi:hypothetical protein
VENLNFPPLELERLRDFPGIKWRKNGLSGEEITISED